MRRAILLVMDSVGIGGAEDSAAFGDEGADTLGHIAEACADGRGDKPGVRSGLLRLPNLVRFGVGQACLASTGRMPPGLDGATDAAAIFGYGVETSTGKDTPSGHWEIAGVPVRFSWTYFPDTEPAFPKTLTDALIA
jgi:phosphopentomutase